MTLSEESIGKRKMCFGEILVVKASLLPCSSGLGERKKWQQRRGEAETKSRQIEANAERQGRGREWAWQSICVCTYTPTSESDNERQSDTERERGQKTMHSSSSQLSGVLYLWLLLTAWILKLLVYWGRFFNNLSRWLGERDETDPICSWSAIFMSTLLALFSQGLCCFCFVDT